MGGGQCGSSVSGTDPLAFICLHMIKYPLLIIYPDAIAVVFSSFDTSAGNIKAQPGM